MNIESLRDYCLSLPLVTECFPFDESTLVFKVENKMFLYTGLDRDEKEICVKCDPEIAIQLRERYPEVTPGYHSNKRLWNSIQLSPALKDDLIKSWICHSYEEVVKKLPKIRRTQIMELIARCEIWKPIGI